MAFADFFRDLLDWLEVFQPFYAKHLRFGLFTGFLSLSGILFAIQNFLLTGLYQNVYGKKLYRSYARRMESGEHPLNRLKLLALKMRRCTTACLVASGCQFVVGLLPHWGAAVFCIALAAFAFIQFIRLYLTQRDVVDSWMEYLRWEADVEDNESNLPEVRSKAG